jgi:hypothetical protein
LTVRELTAKIEHASQMATGRNGALASSPGSSLACLQSAWSDDNRVTHDMRDAFAWTMRVIHTAEQIMDLSERPNATQSQPFEWGGYEAHSCDYLLCSDTVIEACVGWYAVGNLTCGRCITPR